MKTSQFTREEKLAALQLLSDGRTITSVANEYDVHPNTIWKWKQIFCTDPDRAFVSETPDPEVSEVKRLKRRNAELEAENDF